MKDNFIVSIQEAFNPTLPDVGGLMDYLDFMMPYISNWGEDLIETEYYTAEGGKPWLEFRDQVNFQETVLHFFNPDGEYLRSVNGNVSKGRWRLLEKTNKMIIDITGGKDKSTGSNELYELVYLDETFFILQKHGSSQKFLALGYEPMVAGMTWLEYVQALFQQYRNKHRRFILVLTGIAVLVFFVILYTLLR